MTAVTIHRPASDARHSLLPSPRPASEPRRAGRPQLVLVPQRSPAREPAASSARVRAQVGSGVQSGVQSGAKSAVQLTRRGRVVVLLVLVATGVALMLALTGLVGGAAAGTGPARPASHTIVVQPGQTLWSIARDVAPNADRRETIARIIQLNALPASGVSAGERIAVPTR
jgi:LysM repeat protein